MSRPNLFLVWANPLQGLFTDDNRDNGEDEEEHSQTNGDVEKGFFNPAPGGKYPSTVATG